ncbi:MAG: nucleotidyltransferase family protein [Pseudomonadota bacterium]
MTHPAHSPASEYPLAARQPISAMLLAAGRGERMRPLTDLTPKPLLTVQGKPLLQWHLEALAQGGFDNVVVNTAWLGEQISARYQNVFMPQPSSAIRDSLLKKEQTAAAVQIQYSHEGEDFGGALETAGGIARALPLLCPTQTGARPFAALPPTQAQADGVFWVLAGDVFAPDFAFHQTDVDRFTASGKLAHLWLVPNPEHNPRGDFGLAVDSSSGDETGLALSLPADDPRPRYTYSTIGLYRAALFAPPWCDIPWGNLLGIKAPLVKLLRSAMAQHQVSAQLYTGRWTDVGTPQRLEQLNAAPSP